MALMYRTGTHISYRKAISGYLPLLQPRTHFSRFSTSQIKQKTHIAMTVKTEAFHTSKWKEYCFQYITYTFSYLFFLYASYCCWFCCHWGFMFFLIIPSWYGGSVVTPSHLHARMWKQKISLLKIKQAEACVTILTWFKGNLHEDMCHVFVYITVNSLQTNDKCMLIYSKWNEVCPKDRQKMKASAYTGSEHVPYNHVSLMQRKHCTSDT